MKRIIKKSITASTNVLCEPTFTPNELVTFLKGIDELQNKDINIISNNDESFNLIIDNDIYTIAK